VRYLVLRWVILALAIALTAWLLPGFTVSGGLLGIVIVSAVLGLINAIVRPIVTLFTCPLVILTLGLFLLVINALMLSLTAWLLSDYVQLSSFWTTLFAALIISIVSAVLNSLVHGEDN
jgi:putative membrane protein